MDWEFAFKFLWLFAQLCAVCMVGAFVSDHIVQPVLDRSRRRKPARVSDATLRGGTR